MSWWCVVLCMNCSFEESWRESMLMMILQLCCPAISPWMTLMTWMTLTMMIMMMRVFTWKVCQWGRMTSTGGWQRWHGSLTPVTRKFPDTVIHSSGWLLFPDVGISQLQQEYFIMWMWPRHWEYIFSFSSGKRPVRAENTRIMIFSRLGTQTGNWIVNYRRKHVRMVIRMRSAPCLSKSNTLIFRGYSFTDKLSVGIQKRDGSLKVNVVIICIEIEIQMNIHDCQYIFANIRGKVERRWKCGDQIDVNIFYVISKDGKKLESLLSYIDKRIKHGLERTCE